jgi:protein-L-isoaspartate(D-aspartate) O-methyltransferase
VTEAEELAKLVLELRSAGVTDPRILGAIERVPRALFVPSLFRDRAYENVALPIGHGQTISQPLVVARMTEALELTERHIVLEIGTGSGYQAAVLARLARRVFTVERHRAMLKTAEERFRQLRLHNITVRFGDGTKGWPEQPSFDRIIVTAAAATLPDALLQSLAEDGVLVAPVGESKRDQALLRIRRCNGDFTAEELGAVRFVPLVAGLPRSTRQH